MKRVRGTPLIDYLPALGLLLLTAAFIAAAVAYTPQARQFPVAVGSAMLVLIGLDAVSRTQTPLGVAVRVRLNPAGGSHDDGRSRRAQFAVVAWLAGFATLLVVAGILCAVAAYILFSLRLRAARSWWVSLLGASTATVVIWLLFSVALQLELYRGFLPGGNQ